MTVHKLGRGTDAIIYHCDTTMNTIHIEASDGEIICAGRLLNPDGSKASSVNEIYPAIPQRTAQCPDPTTHDTYNHQSRAKDTIIHPNSQSSHDEAHSTEPGIPIQ